MGSDRVCIWTRDLEGMRMVNLLPRVAFAHPQDQAQAIEPTKKRIAATIVHVNAEDAPAAAKSAIPKEPLLESTLSPEGMLEPFVDLSFAPDLNSQIEGVPEIITLTNEADVFYPVSPQHEDVKYMVDKFMDAYRSEVEIANLNADVLHILKAEARYVVIKTEVRPELEEQDSGLSNELQQEMTQQFHIFMLVKYHFNSAMFAEKRPYVTVLRIAMDCANTTNADDGSAKLECDILEHMDLPRVNESTSDIPAYIQREIATTAPPDAVKNHSFHVVYDALESQDLKYDATNKPIHGVETMKYVRFRLDATNPRDCMVVVQHSKGISTLLYSDLVCYDSLHSASVAMAAFKYTRENYPTVVFIAACIGAAFAIFILHRRRSRQRSGYSYLHSKNSKLPRLSSQNGSTKTIDSVEAAIAS
ncbi:hypothetical protein FI667_g11670, partial [Globisporangium splendens]